VHSVQLRDNLVASRDLGCQSLLEVGQEWVSFTRLVFEPGHKLTLPLCAPLVFNDIRFGKLPNPTSSADLLGRKSSACAI
jgi:hypothetical protein